MNMYRSRLAYGVLLAAAVLGSPHAMAQARGPSAEGLRELHTVDPEVAHATRLADLDVWLRRLVGRFKVYHGGGIPGVRDCVGIGDGAGVQCAFGPPADNRLGPQETGVTMVLYGMDPDRAGIRFLQVNYQGIAEAGRGRLAGDTAVLGPFQCPQSVGQRATQMMIGCERQLRIYAPAGSRTVLIETRTTMRMMPTGRRSRSVGSRETTFNDDVTLVRVSIAGNTMSGD